jgi:hypothetical protein
MKNHIFYFILLIFLAACANQEEAVFRKEFEKLKNRIQE